MRLAIATVGFALVFLAGCSAETTEQPNESDGAAGDGAPPDAQPGAAGQPAGTGGGSSAPVSPSGQAGEAADMPAAGAPSDPTESSVVVRPPDELPEAFAEAVCAAMKACVGQSALLEMTRREDCTLRVTGELRATDFAYMDDAIRGGRVLYAAARLHECTQGIVALGCDVLSHSFPQACVEVLAGNVELGGQCAISAECEGNAFCGGDSCPSVCRELLAAGEPCRRDVECGDGLICLAGRCQAPAQPGEACGGTSGGACALGLNCMGATDTVSGHCVANAEVQVGDEGEPCEPGGLLCQEGLSCVFDGGGGFHCEAAVEADASCHLGLPSQCPSDQYCAASDVTQPGTCRGLPGEGEPCALSGLCAAGLVCVPQETSQVCQPISGNGGACEADVGCRSGRCVEGECVPPLSCG